MAAMKKAACSVEGRKKAMDPVQGRDEEERDWSTLPGDLVCAFARRLQCPVDRAAMELLCRPWHAAVRHLPRPKKHLPWMLVPYRRTCFLHHNVFRKGHFFCILSARAHTMPLPSRCHGSRFIGSVEGGWVFIASGHNCGYAIVNFRTGISIPLPERVIWGGIPVSEPMIILAAAASCAPHDSLNTVIASIVSNFERPFHSHTLLCFSRLGGSVFGCATEMDVEDVIYFNGAFHCVNKTEDLFRCVPNFHPSNNVDNLAVVKYYKHFVPLHHDENLFIKGRYLVESRGQLLMVVRFKSLSSDATSSFSVFAAVESSGYHIWKGLDSLDGRMIFLAKGGSKCYDIGEHPQSHEGVYFLDDDTFRRPSMVAFGFTDGRQYTCHDNGLWRGPGLEIKKWYDWRVPSSYSPPIWFLH